MGKTFAGIGLVGVIGASFTAGMFTMMFLEGYVPEVAHQVIDSLHEVLVGKEA